MHRIHWMALTVLVSAVTVQAQHQHTAAPSKLTDAQKIASAKGAAPSEISSGATIMDWPDTPDGKPRQLLAGTNGWVCFPNTPTEFANASAQDPMCLDGAWQKWADAWSAKKAPENAGFGIAYMLKGDKGASNTDPFATKATPDNHWIVSGPHVMVLLPDAKQLEAYSDDPSAGGPFIMWKGTPYAHLMVPVSTKPKPMTMSHPATKPAPPAPKP